MGLQLPHKIPLSSTNCDLNASENLLLSTASTISSHPPEPIAVSPSSHFIQQDKKNLSSEHGTPIVNISCETSEIEISNQYSPSSDMDPDISSWSGNLSAHNRRIMLEKAFTDILFSEQKGASRAQKQFFDALGAAFITRNSPRNKHGISTNRTIPFPPTDNTSESSHGISPPLIFGGFSEQSNKPSSLLHDRTAYREQTNNS